MKNNVLLALEKLYTLKLGSTFDEMFEDIACRYLNIFIGTSEREIIYYNSYRNLEAAIYIDTLEFLTNEEIEEELDF